MVRVARLELVSNTAFSIGKQELCSLLCSKVLFHLLGSTGDHVCADVCVDVHCSCYLRMAEERLRGLSVNTALEKRGRVAVTDLMRGDGDASGLLILFIGIIIVVVGQGLTVWLGEEIALGQSLRQQFIEGIQKRHLSCAFFGLWLLDLGVIADIVDGL